MQPIIKRTQIQQLEGAAQLAALPELGEDFGAPADQGPEGAPACLPKTARLVRCDGQVRAIEFQCSCGELTLLELEFPDGDATPGGDRAPAADPPADPSDPPPPSDEESS